ncbi:PilZ domain protein [Croceibacterium atlanticum]|uniref:PilZ domain protein n=2 Tax=Croceibacterium atlanticum TaxID=1267766 RepID=A0A0F7KV86_9SPHN|nr:PilZ domain protein [Croceibacterium atlanticum]
MLQDRVADRREVEIEAHCFMQRRSFPLSVTDISVDGCAVRAIAQEPLEQADFLKLRIANSIEVNGKIAWLNGETAGVRFFGQINPVVVEMLLARKATLN